MRTAHTSILLHLPHHLPGSKVTEVPAGSFYTVVKAVVREVAGVVEEAVHSRVAVATCGRAPRGFSQAGQGVPERRLKPRRRSSSSLLARDDPRKVTLRALLVDARPNGDVGVEAEAQKERAEQRRMVFDVA